MQELEQLRTDVDKLREENAVLEAEKAAALAELLLLKTIKKPSEASTHAEANENSR